MWKPVYPVIPFSLFKQTCPNSLQNKGRLLNHHTCTHFKGRRGIRRRNKSVYNEIRINCFSLQIFFVFVIKPGIFAFFYRVEWILDTKSINQWIQNQSVRSVLRLCERAKCLSKMLNELYWYHPHLQWGNIFWTAAGSPVFVCLQCKQLTYRYIHTPAGLLFSIYYNTSKQSVYILTSPVQLTDSHLFEI